MKYRATPLFALLFLPACPIGQKVGDNPTATTSDEPMSTTMGTESGGPTSITGGPVPMTNSGGQDTDPFEWPAVACGDVMCAAGEVCVYNTPSCELIPDPCEVTGETTGATSGGDTESGGDTDIKMCFEPSERLYTCEPIPEDCSGTQDWVTNCIESSELCYSGGYVVDDILECWWCLDCCEEGNPGYYTCDICF